MKLFIPCGVPGCGKTTLAGVLDHNNFRIVSSDAIREELNGDAKDQSNNNDVFRLYHERIESYLLDGFDVFADATNLRDFARQNLREIAERVGAETHLIVFANPNQAVVRNTKRERVVPPEAMVKMLTQYERALRDIPEEQYSSVMVIDSVG